MSSQVFLWIGLTFVLFVVLLFTWGRRSHILSPSKLNLRSGNKATGNSADNANRLPGQVFVASRPTDPFEAKMKNLNVMFMYNGHSFDAYEVLGIPAGSSYQTAQKAYEELMQNTDPMIPSPTDILGRGGAVQGGVSQKEFLKAALFAIRQGAG